MNNREKYDNAFIESLGVTAEQLQDLEYQSVPAWDSIGHMGLVAEIEEAFDVEFETDDIVDFSSYKKGIELLTKYNVTIE